MAWSRREDGRITSPVMWRARSFQKMERAAKEKQKRHVSGKHRSEEDSNRGERFACSNKAAEPDRH
ncbi:hypothetical protein O6227_23680, partial [Salmonella enterica subsp. enterica]